MSSFRVLSRNVLSNWVTYVVSAVITFFLTPMILREIGDARYGVWGIVISLTGYYGLLDLGMRAGMTQYVTRYYSTGDHGRMNGAASSGFALHSVSAVMVIVATIATALLLPRYATFAEEIKTEAAICVLIVGFSTAIQLLLFPFSVALTATQRLDLVTVCGLVARLVSAAATLGCLYAGYGLVGVCLAAAVGNFLDYGLRWVMSRRVLPQLKVSLRWVTWASCRECMGFGLWSVLLAASGLVINLTDAIVIGFFMPISAVAFFTLANNLIRYFANVFVPVSHVLFPAATDLDARGDVAGLQKLYLTATRAVSLLTVTISLVMGFWSADFFSLWVGDSYIDSSVYHSVPLLFKVLLIGSVCTVAQGVGSKVLLGRRHIKPLAWLLMIEGTLNLVISVSLIHTWGLLGVAMGTAIPAVICRGIAQPIMVCSDLKIDAKQYLREILGPTVVVVGILTPLIAILHHYTVQGEWWNLLAQGMVAMSLGLAVITVFGLSGNDRERYLYPSAKRIAVMFGIAFKPLLSPPSDTRS